MAVNNNEYSYDVKIVYAERGASDRKNIGAYELHSVLRNVEYRMIHDDEFSDIVSIDISRYENTIG